MQTSNARVCLVNVLPQSAHVMTAAPGLELLVVISIGLSTGRMRSPEKGVADQLSNIADWWRDDEGNGLINIGSMYCVIRFAELGA